MYFSNTPGTEVTDGPSQLAFVRDWLVDVRASVSYLEHRWFADTGRGLPRLPDGYRPLMRFALAHSTDSDLTPAPRWLTYNSLGPLPLSTAGARLLDGVYGYLAGTMQAELGGSWEVRPVTSMQRSWPLMLGERISPTGWLGRAVEVVCGIDSPFVFEYHLRDISAVRGIEHDPALYDGAPFGLHEDVLHAGPEAWATNLEAVPARWPTGEITLVTWAEVMAREPEMPVHELVLRAFSEDPDGGEVLHPPDFTHTVEVFSHLEYEIGEDVRAGLEEILLQQPGILETSGEDREWLYLKAPGMTDDEVLALVRRVVVRLREEFKRANKA